MGRIVIVAYRPRSGREKALDSLMRRHHGRLRSDGLVIDRPPMLMRAADGTLVEIFEWSAAAPSIDARVKQMWSELAEIADAVALRDLPEAAQLVAGFDSLLDEALHPELSP
jgi:hypothetical protein